MLVSPDGGGDLSPDLPLKKSAENWPSQTGIVENEDFLQGEAFIRLSPVLDIIETAIYSGRVYREKPVSLMLIAEQESAKTQCLLYFQKGSTLRYLSDFTSKGIRPFRAGIESMEIRHLVILDLVKVLSHGRTVSERAIQTLASIMEEGQGATSDAGGLDEWKGFPKIGVLMSITPQYFRSKRGQWRQTGFLSRFLPIFYEYSRFTVNAIHEKIRQGYHIPEAPKMSVPAKNRKISMPDQMALYIEHLSKTYSEQHKLYGFRFHVFLRSLAMAHAMRENRKIVSHDDITKVLSWVPFFSTETPVRL